MQDKTTNFAAQIKYAQQQAMREDPGMICMGLGINDPKAIFGTTQGLEDEFGSQRVFDMPTSENAMTGIGIGAAIAGTRVLMTHQRVDFFLLALDQLVNNAAKWHYMFEGQMSVPLTLRLIIGRGWGQGPTHQQSLQSLFAHIPGLKVVTPGLTDNVGQLLYKSILDNSPTIFLEHRWLHHQLSDSSAVTPFDSPVQYTRRIKKGGDFTVICNSYMLSEVLNAQAHLSKFKVELDIVEVSSPSDIDWSQLIESVQKTKKCLITDIGHLYCSLASEIAQRLYTECFNELTMPIKTLGLPDYPEPTSYGLTQNYYPTANTIINYIAESLGINIALLDKSNQHDVPGEWFKGPF